MARRPSGCFTQVGWSRRRGCTPSSRRSAISQEVPHAAPVSLSIVGKGTEAYETRLRQQVEALRLSERVHFHPWLPAEAIPQIMAEHDVLLVPSIWPEPLARVIQEGMAAGLAVIGTPVGGTPEIIEDGVNGLLFEAGNAPLLAQKIQLLQQDASLYQRLTQAGKQTVSERFTLERMVDEIEAHLLAVAGGAGM